MKSVLIAAFSIVATGAAAQDRVLSFDLGVGAESAPAYFGADDVETDATGTFGLNRLVLGGLSLGGVACQTRSSSRTTEVSALISENGANWVGICLSRLGSLARK